MRQTISRLLADIRQYKWVAIAFLLYNMAVMTVIGAFCPMEIITGFPCPGCGMTRALLCVIIGQFGQAFRYNACIYLWIPLGLYWGWNRYIKGRKAKGMPVLLCAVAAVMILWHVYRMTVAFPGEEPLVFFENNMIGRVLPVYNEIVRTRLLN